MTWPEAVVVVALIAALTVIALVKISLLGPALIVAWIIFLAV